MFDDNEATLSFFGRFALRFYHGNPTGELINDMAIGVLQWEPPVVS